MTQVVSFCRCVPLCVAFVAILEFLWRNWGGAIYHDIVCSFSCTWRPFMLNSGSGQVELLLCEGNMTYAAEFLGDPLSFCCFPLVSPHNHKGFKENDTPIYSLHAEKHP